MALSTYTELGATVARWLHRSDLTAQVPDFIALCEAEINRRLRVRPMVTTATASIADEYSAVPDDFAHERTFVLTDPVQVHLVPTNQDQIDQLAAGCSTTGTPSMYAVVGQQFRFYPAPDQAYDSVLTYYAKVPALSDTAQSNWLLASHPDAYLYGACAQASPYMIEDNRIPVWTGKFEQIIGQIEASLKDGGVKSLRADPGLLRARSFNIQTG